MTNGNKPNILPFVFLVFGIYLLNYAFSFFEVPLFFTGIEKWIIGLSGFFLIVAFLRGIFYSKKAILRRAIRQSRRM